MRCSKAGRISKVSLPPGSAYSPEKARILAFKVGDDTTTEFFQDKRARVKKMPFDLYPRFKDLISTVEGQDLVEYTLVVALIAFGAVAAMKGLSTEIKTAFNAISSDLATSL